MSRMTAQDFVSFVRLGVSETSESLSDSQILRLLNQSYLEIASAVNFPELDESTTITTSSGTAEYEVGSDADNIIYINDIVDTTNGIQLREINRYQYDQYTQSSSSSGTPVYWLMTGVGSNSRKQITFFPTPSGAASVVVHYRKKPDDLELSPSPTTPILPQAWDDSLLYRTISRAWRLLGDMTRAEQWKRAAAEADATAYSVTLYASRVPMIPGSIVGQAWSGK